MAADAISPGGGVQRSNVVFPDDAGCDDVAAGVCGCCCCDGGCDGGCDVVSDPISEPVTAPCGDVPVCSDLLATDPGDGGCVPPICDDGFGIFFCKSG